MKHIVLLYYIIAIGLSSFAVGWLVLVYFNKKNEKLKASIMIIGSMILLLVSHYLGNYAIDNIDTKMLSFVYIRLIFRGITIGLVSYFLLMFIFQITLREVKKSAKIFFVVYGIVAGVGSLINSGISNSMIVILLIYCLMYVIYFFWFDKKYIKSDVISKTKKYSIIIVIGIVFIAIDAAIPQIESIERYLPYGFLALPTFIIVMSWITIVEVFNFFRNNFESKNLLNERALENYRITKREREVIGCLYNGKTYQETSDTLNISLATVKTHINNIYKKMEVSNKIEMINKLK